MSQDGTQTSNLSWDLQITPQLCLRQPLFSWCHLSPLSPQIHMNPSLFPSQLLFPHPHPPRTLAPFSTFPVSPFPWPSVSQFCQPLSVPTELHTLPLHSQLTIYFPVSLPLNLLGGWGGWHRGAGCALRAAQGLGSWICSQPGKEGGTEGTFGVSESAWWLSLLPGAPHWLRGGTQVSTKNIVSPPPPHCS